MMVAAMDCFPPLFGSAPTFFDLRYDAVGVKSRAAVREEARR